MNNKKALHRFFCILMLACAIRPVFFIGQQPAAEANPVIKTDWAFSMWHRGGLITQLPLSRIEQRFASGFPGAIARFTDGETAWVVRHLNRPTRMLHPAADCYRGLGFSVSASKIIEQEDGKRWRCFLAEKGRKLKVCERIFDAGNKQWTDASAWYWDAAFRPGKHEWWAVTQVTNAGSQD